MALTKVIYYIGERYLTVLDHPVYGKHEIKEDGNVELPTPYANNLVANSPTLFTDVAPKGKVKATPGKDYEKMAWKDLVVYAKQRGVDASPQKGGKNRIIADLVKLDNERSTELVKPDNEENAESES